MTTATEVLDFWFGVPATTDDELMEKIRRWFAGGEAADAEIRERFSGDVDRAIRGDLDGWAKTAKGRLALVILLDQLSRNVHRNSATAFAGDERAQQLALDAFDKGFDRELSFVERFFLSMPLLHSEKLEHHVRERELGAAFAAEAPPLMKKMIGMHSEQSAKYFGIIERFGRFPHRNAVLGRTSTKEEEEFLVGWAERAPPKGAPKA